MNVSAQNVRSLAQDKRDENFDLRAYFKMQGRLSGEQIDKLVAATASRIWGSFDCTACANCCKEIGSCVTQAEISSMAAALSLPKDEFQAKYVGEEVAPIDRDEPGTSQWMLRGNPCALLKDNRCIVYEDRPAVCRDYPHLAKPSFNHRTLGMIERTYTCPVVYQVFEELKRQLPFRTPHGW